MDIEQLSYFDLDEDLFPWHPARVQEIERRRALLGDTLLFDILLSLGGIRDPDTLYPPNDVPSLERLLNAISTSTYDAMKRDCLVYFLLKWHRDGREKRFGKDKAILPQFVQLAEAYWCLDAGINVPIAVSLLSDSRLNQDYSSKILQTIFTAPDIDPHPLIVRYIRTAKPLLTEPDDLDLYLVALAEHNLFEAWQFQRTFSENDPTRERLFIKMLEWCVSPKPKVTPLAHLLTIPLIPFEESILHSYASLKPSLGLATLQNLSCARLIQTGQYADAIKLHRRFSSVVGGSKSPSSAAMKMVQERNDIIQALYSTLPLVERTLLDAEIQGTPLFGFGYANSGGDVTMSDSQTWEEIHGQELSSSSVRVNGAVDSNKPPEINGRVSSTGPKGQIPSSSSTPATAVNIPSSFSLTGATAPGSARRERESLASSRSGAPRFGGAAPPILPISGTIDTSSISLNSSTGFGGIASLNSSLGAGGLPQIHSQTGTGRKSLPFNSAAFSSSASGVLSSSTSTMGGNSTPFSSSKRKQNAFYKPPVVNNPASPNPFSVEELDVDSPRRRSDSSSPERPLSQGQKQNRDNNAEVFISADEPGTMQIDDGGNLNGEKGLDYSLFADAEGNSGRSSQSRKSLGLAGAPVDNNLRTSSKRPPGAFTDDDDDDDVDMDQPLPPRQTRSRKGTTPISATSLSASAKSASAKSTAVGVSASSASVSSRTGAGKPKGKKPRTASSGSRRRRSVRVPGGIFDDEDEGDDESQSQSEAGSLSPVLQRRGRGRGQTRGRVNPNDEQQEEEEEEQEEQEDRVAPLRRTTRARKTRSSTATAMNEDPEPRRRSSRISTSGLDGGVSTSRSKKASSSTRKSTIGAGGTGRSSRKTRS